MNEQQSQKQGLKSSGQKEQRAREGYEPLPASKPVAGADGDPGPKSATDIDVAFKRNEKHYRKNKSRG